jgi:hypothetical protein
MTGFLRKNRFTLEKPVKKLCLKKPVQPLKKWVHTTCRNIKAESNSTYIYIYIYIYIYFTCPHKGRGEGIRTCDFHFIRRGSQPIELPLRDYIYIYIYDFVKSTLPFNTGLSSILTRNRDIERTPSINTGSLAKMRCK